MVPFAYVQHASILQPITDISGHFGKFTGRGQQSRGFNPVERKNAKARQEGGRPRSSTESEEPVLDGKTRCLYVSDDLGAHD